MPRRPRVNLVGYPQHIVQRGHNRAATFFGEDDCHCYLHWLKQSADKYGCAIHAYALMTNHVHLLISPNQPNGITRLMQSLGRRYAQYVNRFTRAGVAGEAPIGGRLLQDGHIGRVAVLKPWRGRGVGRALLTALLQLARQSGFTEVVLHAQTKALNFYIKQGFVAEGPEFVEAGIVRRVMRLRL